MSEGFTFKRELLDGDEWPFSTEVHDPDELDDWDPVDVGNEDSITTLIYEAQRVGVIVSPPGHELHYSYSADTDGGGYIWMVDLERKPSCTACGRTLERDWAAEGAARMAGEARDDILWLDTTDTSYFCPGTGGFDGGSWHRANFEVPLNLRLASNWEEQRKIVSRDTTGREAMVDILQEAVDVANSLLGSLVRWIQFPSGDDKGGHDS